MSYYAIYKDTRHHAIGSPSYSGGTWDRAGIRTRYKEFYADKKEAEQIANILTRHNPVGFSVERVPNGSPVRDVY